MRVVSHQESEKKKGMEMMGARVRTRIQVKMRVERPTGRWEAMMAPMSGVWGSGLGWA